MTFSLSLLTLDFVHCRGSLSKIASMIPGVPQDLVAGNDEDASRRLKRMMIVTDSMTADELDSDGMCFTQMDATGKEPIGITWRVSRVAKGSGTSVREVEELLCQYRIMANMAKQAGGKNGWYVSPDMRSHQVPLSFAFQNLAEQTPFLLGISLDEGIRIFRPIANCLGCTQAKRSAEDAGCGRDTKRSEWNADTGADCCGAGT
jgi:hypothetical protein